MLDKSKGLVGSTKYGEVFGASGAAGNYFSSPDSSAASITGDIDIRIKASLNDWTPALDRYLVSKWVVTGGGNTSYIVGITPSGALNLAWSTTGSDVASRTSTATLGLSDGATKWVRCTLDVNNGAGGHDVKFFTSNDGTAWVQLGSTITTAGTTSIFDSTAAVNVAGFNSGNVNSIESGKYYRVQILNGIDGTVAVDFDPTRYISGSTFTSATGEVWTLNGLTRIVPDGNHATQTTSAKRPKLAARYNLLTYTEQFDNGVWTKSNAAVTANSVAAPDGTTTADKLIENNGVNRGVIYQLAPQTGQVFSVFAKAAEWNRVAIGFTNGAGLWGMQVFNLSTGALDGTASYGGTTFTNPTITPVGSGWYRCAVTANSVTSTLCAIMPFNQSGDPVNPSPALVGDGTSGIYIWGADLRPTSQATGLIGPTYQRVVDAATYDTAGFLPYLEFNGLSWSMSTGSIDFTATDKMTVWAGYRISAGTGSQQLAELTANGYTTNGGFAVGQGPNAGTSGFGFLMNNGAGIAGETAAITVPYSSVISYQFDSALSGLANEAKLRRNQVAQTYASTTGTDSGTGNFANAPLYLGARLGTSVYINGWLTSLIVRGAQSTQSQIEATESWVNGKTGAY
jgi:hypothetical protein